MEIDGILKNSYALSGIALTKMEGYDSINYKVAAKERTYVLKQYQSSPETIAVLASENQILLQLGQLEKYDFPFTIPTKESSDLVVHDSSVYRLLSFVEGEFLAEAPHTDEMLQSLGSFLGETDKALSGTYAAAIAAKNTPWDLQYFQSNYKYLKFIPHPEDRRLVDYFFLQFDEHIYPVQHQLRKQIIHNDANDWNVLTKNGKVSGIIDFGDMCHSWLINELAIAITYVMMGKENPLEIAVPVIKNYHKIFPLEEHELEVLYYLVAARLCTSVCNSAYSKTSNPHSDYITISEDKAWELLRKWITINPVKAKDTFRKAAGYTPSKKANLENQLKKRREYLSSALSLSYTSPIAMSRSAFQYMYDTHGNTFLDAYNNIMLLGHCHPKVIRAGQKAMARLNTNTRYVYGELLEYSEKLLSKFPSKLNKIFFVNSGSAASDLAIRMAMTHTRKNKVMVLEHGYHGNTRMGIDISPYKYGHKGGSGRPNYIIQTPIPKTFGSGIDDEREAGNYFAAQAVRQIEENKGEIAAFIAEPIVGCGGQVPLAKGYLEQIYPKIREEGGICISDEVQVGFGRLGDYFWGYEMHKIVPDIVILGKPIGNGHPIGAVVTTSEIAENFNNGLEFFSSFGGNPVSCSIGKAVLDIIEEENLQVHAKIVGDHMISLFKNLQNDFIEIADVRGSGLFLGIELTDKNGKPNTRLASEIKNRLREDFILIGTDGPYDHVLKIKPPLPFCIDDSEKLVEKIRLILNSLR
ncbi:MAG: aminotransferase class III-fold pyridoxal phosphate-dependent enzyme [Saonia sp.]